MKKNISNIKKSTSRVLGQLKGKVNNGFFKDLEEFFKNVVVCLEKKSESYKSEPNREEIIFSQELKHCITREIEKNGLPGDLNNSDYKPSICAKTLIVHAHGSWKFNTTNFSQNLISWWLHCFKRNENTAIISESWDSEKFKIFKRRFIQTYISGGRHEVVFLQYDDVDGFTLKFPR
jgi:hypothetical protein